MSDMSIRMSTAQSTAQTDAISSAVRQGTITQEQATAFSNTLAKELAIQQMGKAGSLMSASGTLGSYVPTMLSATAGQGLESQVLALLSMMATGQAGASSIMAVLAQAVQSMKDASDKEKMRRNVMDSGYDNEDLDEINRVVFGEGKSSAFPYEAWKPVSPYVDSEAGNRSAQRYAAVIDQFAVEKNPRYKINKRGQGETYCNIYVWDVTLAMGAEIPHYIDPATGVPRSYPNTKGAKELSANGTYNWLGEHGKRYGWVEVSAEIAQAHANGGSPSVVSWYNAAGPGHLQMVRPERGEETYDAERGVAIAQAGSKLTSYAHARDIFSQRAMGQLKYYIHL